MRVVTESRSAESLQRSQEDQVTLLFSEYVSKISEKGSAPARWLNRSWSIMSEIFQKCCSGRLSQSWFRHLTKTTQKCYPGSQYESQRDGRDRD